MAIVLQETLRGVFYAPFYAALALGAAKYVFKVAIAAIDTVFIYWARASFRRRAVHEAT